MDEAFIFLEALKQPAPDQRAAFLDQACGANDDLRRSVELLLRAHDRAGGFLADAPAAAGVTVGRPVGEGPGTVVSPYKLVQQIGEGGMGTVWMAQQQEPVRRLVALKLIKAGMDSKQVIARFEAERQALALMDHPNIARVLDSGTAPSGRPYFVMDLVKGVPITRYCDEHRLTPRQRLELFIPVCAAVQHAHQKGIIHRDLKPSNVLVALYDGQPVPKVIDFGVAKAAGPTLTEKTLVTGFGAIVGTLEYMSPEQAEINQLDIDTRSDIYSLGVLLYELLTGSTPFTRKELERAGMLEMLRVIREEEPSKPSIKLSTAEGLSALAANRGTEPAKLTKLVRGELDWIVMKALDKDRNRRYETANSFALDVQRYLSGELVQACPPSAGYRLRKFVGRHRGPVLAAGSVFAMLIVLLAVAWVSNRQVNQAVGRLEDEQEKTAQALVRETGLKNRANEALEQAQLALYSYRVSLAQREWYANRVGRADFLLDECPRPLRAWEWHYLKRLCHADLLTFRGHRGNVATAEFSPDGKQVASCGEDGTVRVWDSATGREFRSLKGHTGRVYRVTFSPDGRRLASAGGDRTVRLWDVATGEVIWALRDQTIGYLAFSPDGRHLAASSNQPHLKVWDAGTGQEIRTIKPALGAIWLFAYSRDGASLVWVENNRVVVVADAATGKIRRRIGVPSGAITALALSSDGQRIATGGVNQPVVVWDAASGEKRLTFGFNVWVVAFSPDDRRIATAHADQTARVWDAATGAEVLVLRGHTAPLRHVAFDPDGRRLVTTSQDATVKVWNAAAPQEVRLVSTAPRGPLGIPLVRPVHRVYCLAVSSDGRRLALGMTQGPVRFYDVTECTEMGTLDTGHRNSTCVAFSPDGRRLTTGGNEGTVRIWDVEQKRQLLACPGHERGVNSVAYSPDGTMLATDDGTVRLFDAATGQLLRVLSQRVSVYRLAFSPDSRRLATIVRSPDVGQQGAVGIWDVTTGQELRSFRGHHGPTCCVAFSPDGKHVASAGTDKQVKLWDAATGTEIRTLGVHATFISAVAFHPDGRRLAVGTGDGSIVVWDLTTGREALTLRSEHVSRGLAFLPNGTSLVAACDDGFLRFWNGTPLQEPSREGRDQVTGQEESRSGVNENGR